MALYERLPGMVRAMLLVLLADWLAAYFSRTGLGGLDAIMFVMGSLVAFWGGLEAVHWIIRSSPWVRLFEMMSRKLEEPRPDVVQAEVTAADTWLSLVQDLPLSDRPELRRGLLRLLSGATVAFAVLTLVKLGLPAKLPGLWQTLLTTFEIERARLLPLAVGAVLWAPALALLLGREEPPRGSEWIHVLLATALSVGIIVWLHGQGDNRWVPWDRFLERLAQRALDPSGVFYGLMVGGVFWWKIGFVASFMRNPEE